jgi:putative transposase
MNRGNAQATLFHDEHDYRVFRETMRRAVARIPMRLLAWCIMPNHFHLLLWPLHDGELGRWMHWLLTTHVQHHRRKYGTVGRIWQGRFKSPPIQQDSHLITVMRYIERNPLRAGLVRHAEAWPWSSLHARLESDDSLLCRSPVELGPGWRALVNQPLSPAEIKDVRASLHRELPYGDPAWTRGTAERLGLPFAVRPRGRPRISAPGSRN